MIINPPLQPDTKAIDLKGADLWFPVRQSGGEEDAAHIGHEFILLSEWGVDQAHAESNCNQTNAECGNSYAKANPVIRYTRVRMFAVEVPERIKP